MEGLAEGVYYYHPVEHALVTISPGTHIDGVVHAPPNRPIFDDSAFSIFLVGQLDAVAPLYPEQARDFCLLEAGYMGQLLMTVAPEHELGLCPIGGLYFDQIRSHFALGDSHELLHSFCGGGVATLPSATGGMDFARELQRFLGARIPDYMVPRKVLLLDALPLTSNGKVKRDALPRPDSDAAQSFTAPQSELEKAVAQVWQEVLGLDSLNAESNFFELGATSLHLVRVRAKLEKLTGGDLPVAVLFRHPTISTLAAFLASGNDDRRLLDESNSRAETRKSLQRRRPSKG